MHGLRIYLGGVVKLSGNADGLGGMRKGGVSLRASLDGESITITGHLDFEDHGCRGLCHLVTAVSQ